MFGTKILTLVPTSEEMSAFINVLAKSYANKFNIFMEPINRSDSSEAVIRYDSFRFGHWVEVRLVACGVQGQAVEPHVRGILQDFSPHLVIIAGIAGGAPGKDIGLCDVVVSDNFTVPLSVKRRDSDEQARLTAAGGTFSQDLDRRQIFARAAERTRLAVQENLRPSKEELREAAENQGLKGHDLDRAVEVAELHFSRIFGKSSTDGVRIRHAEGFSQTTNQQSSSSIFLDLAKILPELAFTEMEAGTVLSVMRSFGRSDTPLLIKSISDIPGFIRIESIKNIARDISAHALLNIIFDEEFLIVLRSINKRKSRHRPSRDSDSLSLRIAETLLSHTNLKATNLLQTNVMAVAQSVEKDPTLAVPMADLLMHYTHTCPRCGFGVEGVKPFLPIFEKTLKGLSQNTTEIFRSTSLAAVAPVLGIEISMFPEKLEDYIIERLRRSDQGGQLRGSAFGFVYHLMSRQPLNALHFVRKLSATECIPDSSISIWFFTAISAAVNRGADLAQLRRSFASEWNRLESLYAARNPFSLTILEAAPALRDAAQARRLQVKADDRVKQVLADELLARDFSDRMSSYGNHLT